MNSPFEVFRKHQKVAMVVLVFMSMFAFIVLDSVQRLAGTSLSGPVVGIAVGLLLGGVFWFVGNPKGQGKEYAVLGFVIGVAAGVIGPMINRPAPAFSSTVGRLTRAEMGEEIHHRQQANNFLRRVEQKIAQRYLKQHPNARPNEVPRMNENYLFSLFRHRSPEQDVGYTLVFRHEADKMGIKISDDAVTDYLKKATDGKMLRSDYLDSLRETGVSEDQLYSTIKDELRARLAFDCLRPRAFPVPDDYWQLYRRLNVREELEVAAVPVSAFAAEVEDPGDKALADFFTLYKNDFPTREVTDKPAFGQPRRVQVAYLKAGTDQLEGTVSTALDKEIAQAEASGKPTPIEKFYEKNKDRYRNPTFPEKPATKSGPKLSAPDLPGAEEKKPEDKSEEKKGDEKESEKAKPEPQEKEGGEKKSDEKPDAAKPEDKKSEDKKSEDGKPEEKKSEEGAAGSSDELEEEQEEKADEKPAEAKKPEEKKPEEKKPDEKKGDDPAVPDAAPAAPEDGSATAEVPGEPLPEEATTDPLPEFQPLDDKLKDDIRRQLINERVAAQLDKRIRKAEAEMTRRADKVHAQMIPEPGKSAPKEEIDHEQISTDLKAWASENGFRYGATDLVTFEELSDPDSHPIGVASEAQGDQFNARSVAMVAFQTDPKQTYFPTVAIDRITGNRYCWWKMNDVKESPGSFDAKGTKEKVLAAWKMMQARKPAEERAEAVAEMIKKAEGKPMSETLAGQTVTGKEGGLLLTVRETEPFSWLRRGTAPAQNPFATPPPELSTISAIEKPDEDFMEVIFQKLKEGETGVAANADKSTYYVVRVKNRVPSTEAGEEEMRKQFLASRNDFFPDADPFMRMFRRSPYVQLMEQEQAALFLKWEDDLAKKYQIYFPPRETAER